MFGQRLLIQRVVFRSRQSAGALTQEVRIHLTGLQKSTVFARLTERHIAFDVEFDIAVEDEPLVTLFSFGPMPRVTVVGSAYLLTDDAGAKFYRAAGGLLD